MGLCWSFEWADTGFSAGHRVEWVRCRLREVFEASSTAWLNTGVGLSSEKAEWAVSKFSIHWEEFYQNLDQQWQPSVTTGIKKYGNWYWSKPEVLLLMRSRIPNTVNVNYEARPFWKLQPASLQKREAQTKIRTPWQYLDVSGSCSRPWMHTDQGSWLPEAGCLEHTLQSSIQIPTNLFILFNWG